MFRGQYTENTQLCRYLGHEEQLRLIVLYALFIRCPALAAQHRPERRAQGPGPCSGLSSGRA